MKSTAINSLVDALRIGKHDLGFEDDKWELRKEVLAIVSELGRSTGSSLEEIVTMVKERLVEIESPTLSDLNDAVLAISKENHMNGGSLTKEEQSDVGEIDFCEGRGIEGLFDDPNK